MIHLKRTFNAKSTPVKISTAAHGPNAYLMLYPADGSEPLMLVGKAEELTEELKTLAARLNPLNVAQVEEIKQDAQRLKAHAPNWDWLTPQMVIEFFSLSSVLRTHLPDVIEVLEKTEYLTESNQLNQDVETLRPYAAELLTEDGEIQRGYTRKAAALLFGDESANGGTYLKRIKEAMRILKTTFTTTTKKKANDSDDDMIAA